MNKLPRIKNEKNRGQALLIVLLVLSVVLTLSLSVVSRSITDVKITSTEDTSVRAFSAAEAGVEQALVTNLTPGTYNQNLTSSQSNYSVVIPPNSPTQNYRYFPNLQSGEVATVWLADRSPSTGLFTCSSGNCFSGSQVEVCWGDSTSTDVPAVELTLFYDSNLPAAVTSNDYQNVGVKRFTYDALASTRADSFGAPSASTPGCTDPNGATSFKYTSGAIVVPPTFGCSAAGCLLMARVKVYYTNNVPVSLKVTGSNLPPQGTVIQSTGSSGNTKRAVEVFQNYPEPPSIFDSAIFSTNNLTK